MKLGYALLKLKMKFLPALFSSKDMIEYLKACHITIGKGCRFYRPASMDIDVSRPLMLEIGDYAKITAGVTILAHDYSRSVLRRAYGEVVGEAQKTVIGNNVFIGMNTIVLMGANIGDHSIIGAGSVVRGEIPPYTVAAGNPAKPIMSLEDYYLKRKKASIEEAKEYIRIFVKKKGRVPTASEMLAFWPLFMPKDATLLKQNGIRTNLGGDNEEEVIRDFLTGEAPAFCSLEELINVSLQGR